MIKKDYSIIFKIASEKWEFEQIHKLNYKTFIEEIPQHKKNSKRILIDQFHKNNTYIICLVRNNLIGMISVSDKRPFSLDKKLENIDSYLPSYKNICEIRLLAVEKNYRKGWVFKGMLGLLAGYIKDKGYDLAVISGIVNKINLYKSLGSVPFGPVVSTSNIQFQPMYITFEKFKENFNTRINSAKNNFSNQIKSNFLPGPVNISKIVYEAFTNPPISHRSKTFINVFNETKRLLCQITKSKYVQIFMGSGTLANDVIAAQLSSINERGLIISNGEFGERLIDHANRLKLVFDILKKEWGKSFNRKGIENLIHNNPKIKWLWAVHCETSAGILNNMDMLKEICSKYNVFLCLDCISSIGTVEVDLNGVYLASGVSGKGLGAFTGLSMVFYNEKLEPNPKLPRYLDIGIYSKKNGIPYTFSSNLLFALRASLKNIENIGSKNLFKKVCDDSKWLKSKLNEVGLKIITASGYSSPAVITIKIPKKYSSTKIGYELEKKGIFISYNSEYLIKRNWIQICIMGDYSRYSIIQLLEFLKKIK